VPVVPRDEWDSICLNYTSGTTDKPKGVLVSPPRHLDAIGNIAALTCESTPSSRFK
jgi:fatty-acyl-CoA synthase